MNRSSSRIAVMEWSCSRSGRRAHPTHLPSAHNGFNSVFLLLELVVCAASPVLPRSIRPIHPFLVGQPGPSSPPPPASLPAPTSTTTTTTVFASISFSAAVRSACSTSPGVTCSPSRSSPCCPSSFPQLVTLVLSFALVQSVSCYPGPALSVLS